MGYTTLVVMFAGMIVGSGIGLLMLHFWLLPRWDRQDQRTLGIKRAERCPPSVWHAAEHRKVRRGRQ